MTSPYVWIGAIGLLAFLWWMSSRPMKPKKVGYITHTSAYYLPDGIYYVLFGPDKCRHVMLSLANASGPHEQVYAVHVSELPTNKDGSLMEHFIKTGKKFE